MLQVAAGILFGFLIVIAFIFPLKPENPALIAGLFNWAFCLMVASILVTGYLSDQTDSEGEDR